MTTQPLIDAARDAFIRQFSMAPRIGARAPGRVNLIGEHTDYTEGLAMPFAIDRHVIMLGAQRGANDNTVQLSSTESEQPLSIDLRDRPIQRASNWSDYLRGVFEGLRAHGIDIPAMNIMVHSNLPAGAGLSSSAALEVAAIRLMLKATGQSLDDQQIMQLAQTAEHEYAGVPCGLLDQFSVTVSQQDHLLLFDSRTLTGTPIPMPGTEMSFLVINSKVSHALSDGEYASRRAQCETLQEQLGHSLRDATVSDIESVTDDALLRKRGIHIVTENERVLHMRDALHDADWKTAGALMYASHASLRDDFEVSCAETDLLVALASDLANDGVVGARMTGGGFGGSVIALIHRDQYASIASTLRDQYRAATGLDADTLLVKPSAAAHAFTLQGDT